jgi:amidophosphoribosyltransferase
MCGIVGISTAKNEASIDIFEALLMLQHRGQDAAGITTFDGKSFHEKKDSGLVFNIFSRENLIKLKGNLGLGHVRYPTNGSDDESEAQPFYVNAPFGISLVHNGNLTNTEELRKIIQKNYRRHLKTSSDSEVLLNIFADKIYREWKKNIDNFKVIDLVFPAIKGVMQEIEGAYSVITLIDSFGLVAFRDPHGIRPLVLGRRENDGKTEYMVASEDVAFQAKGFKRWRDVEAGEAVLIDLQGNFHSQKCIDGELSPCIFEYIYLARPDSMLDEISVYKTQLRLGEKLAQQITDSKLDIDVIIPVPDSSRPAALEMAHKTGIKYREGLVKNRYIGRTFIMPNQQVRAKSVRRKLNIIPLEFKNRKVLLVDDSIVRGTTIKKIIEMCREAGASKVYVASAAPPIKYQNVYGIDMPTKKELIASDKSIEEMRIELKCDALFFQHLDDAVWAAQQGNPAIKKFDCSCFDGKYVTGDVSEKYLSDLNNQRKNN